MDFKAGDVVMLKSGGPLMTIKICGDLVSGKNSAYCFWFDGTELRKDSFSIPQLDLADKPKA